LLKRRIVPGKLIGGAEAASCLGRHQLADQESHLLQGVMEQHKPAGSLKGVLARLPELYDQGGLLCDARFHQFDVLARGDRGPVHVSASFVHPLNFILTACK
jgi:hypothetical protein